MLYVRIVARIKVREGSQTSGPRTKHMQGILVSKELALVIGPKHVGL